MLLWEIVARFLFDERYFPLVLVQSPEEVERDGLEQLFRDFERLFRLELRYALVLDLTNIGHIPSAATRKQIATWEAAHIADTKRWNIGVAIALKSALVRGALTALSWVVQDESPRVHVATRAQAIEHGIKLLEGEGIAITPAIVELRREIARDRLAS